MNLPNITLISFGYFEKDILEKTDEAVKQEFNCSVSLKEGHLDLSEFYDTARRQYNGNMLLKQVDSWPFRILKNPWIIQCRPFYSNSDLYFRTGLFRRSNRNCLTLPT